jgi:hypothetical protein
MSLAKSILAFILSSLFVISLYLTINSYTLGSLLQKDNLKVFVQSQVTGELAESTCHETCSSQVNAQACENSCGYLDPSMQPACVQSCQSGTAQEQAMQMCVSQCMARVNQSQSEISGVIDSIYDKDIADGVTLSDATGLFSGGLLLLIVTIILGTSLYFVAEKPLSKIGSSVFWVAVSLLLVALIPVIVVTNNSMLNLILGYLFSGFYAQAIIGVILLAAGIVLLVVGKKTNR